MGLSPYQTPTDAGVLCAILVNSAISWSYVKDLVRSILHVMGIHIASWEEFPIENHLGSTECRESPSESYINKFRSSTPTFRYESLSNCRDCPQQDCSVCLTEFKPDSEINYLSCGHVFHKFCMEKWIKYWNITCPLCRNYMVPHEMDEDTSPM